MALPAYLVRSWTDDFYLHVTQTSIADLDFYPHIYVRRLTQKLLVFIRMDLRYLIKNFLHFASRPSLSGGEY